MNKTALLVVDFQNDYFPSFDGAKWALSQVVDFIQIWHSGQN